MAHAFMENRSGLCVDAEVTQADGFAEREAAVKMTSRHNGNRRITVAADKGYDTKTLGRKSAVLSAAS